LSRIASPPVTTTVTRVAPATVAVMRIDRLGARLDRRAGVLDAGWGSSAGLVPHVAIDQRG
jgi:hypothetical protein